MDDRTTRSATGQETLAEARQRWRITFCRDTSAPPLPQRDYIAAWEAGIAASSLPVLMGAGAAPRPRLAFAAALPVGMAADHELAELFLTERLPVHAVRDELIEHVPVGHRVLDIHDVWLGEPGLQSQVTAAEYRVELIDGGPSDDEVRAAAARLLAAAALPRSREKGGGTVPYDLRPLLGDITVVTSEPVVLRIRTMFHVQRGFGRPEEVVAALADALGQPLDVATTVRERVIVEERRPDAEGSSPRGAAPGPRRPKMGGPRQRG